MPLEDDFDVRLFVAGLHDEPRAFASNPLVVRAGERHGLQAILAPALAQELSVSVDVEVFVDVGDALVHLAEKGLVAREAFVLRGQAGSRRGSAGHG